MADDAKTDPKTDPTTGAKGGAAGLADALAALTPTLEPLTGKASVDEKSGYVGELVAYAALDDALTHVVNRVHAAGPTGVLVVEDRALLTSCWSYAAIDGETTRLTGAVREVAELVTGAEPAAADDGHPRRLLALAPLVPLLTAAVTGLGALPKVAGVAADLAGMFRTEYSFAGRSMSPQGTPVVAETARLLRGRGVRVFVDGFRVPRQSPLLHRVGDLRAAVHDLRVAAVPLRASAAAAAAAVTTAEAAATAARTAFLEAAAAGPVPKALTTAQTTAAQTLARAQERAAAPQALVALVDTVAAAADAFVAAVTAAGPQGEAPPLAAAQLREHLMADDAATRTVSHVLFVSLDSVGAETAVREKRFGPDDVTFVVGGLQVSFLLLDVEQDEVVDGGSHRRLGTARFDPARPGLLDHTTTPVGGPGVTASEVGGASSR